MEQTGADLLLDCLQLSPLAQLILACVKIQKVIT